ncbi:hypothetical protein P872_12185 [Rhodonellum psychrophilum GCM71 = DSM 17998]|uniref:Uncharacterized protein n=2 Tax=Rhodonellum TaxID=336827 RepID=U5BW56_9BACT|nr:MULTISPECIES: hypothetical protein [Rhodonellum]ERM80826.1 hypothetical protein P872_12185 [Rhodonellum psychrophilum GCM71 = DSM 17998]SDZ23973.1 hypothetical protein SAMN05444412_10868 [Rhodonellum ikkaensis]
MALAILKHINNVGDKYIFEADIGTNAYYQYKIGKSKRNFNGLDFIDDIQYQSESILSRVPNRNGFNTKFPIAVPKNVMDRNSRFIQLFSFKNPSQLSPAISEVVTLSGTVSGENDDFKLPKIMTLSTQKPMLNHDIIVEHAPFRLKEEKLGEAMFFNVLIGALPSLLGTALPAIGKLIPGLVNALPTIGKIVETAGQVLPEIGKTIPQTEKPGQGGLQQIMQQISPEVLQAILQVIQSQTPKTENGNGLAENKSIFSRDLSINPALLLQLAPLLEKVLSPETITAIGDSPVKLFQAVSDSALKFQKMELDHLEKINPGVNDTGLDKIVSAMRHPNGSNGANSKYSQAKVAPALLAALPALMPLLQNLLSPETIKAVGEQPLKLFNAIADAGLKHSKQELDHLERINPGVDDPALDQIVNSMSFKSAVSIKAKFDDSLSIKFLHAHTTPISGKAKVVYDSRQKIHFPVQLMNEDPESKQEANIPKGIFQLIIQDGNTMEILLEKKYRVKNIPLGLPIQDIFLEADEISKLPLQKDLKVELTFNWKRGNKTVGTFKNHYIYLSNGYLFQRVGGRMRDHFMLNDVNRFRNYWHKIWEGGPSTHKRWNIDMECKYYYHINEESENIKKLEVRRKVIHDSARDESSDYRRKISTKIMSGMEVSLEAYNELMKHFQKEPLDDERLMAFRSENYVSESGLAARVSVDFKGQKGETSSLWVYPEGSFQSYVISKIMGTDAAGMVNEILDEEVYFPKFSSAHFIGTKSQ